LDEDDLKEADINEGIRNTLSLLSPQLRDHIKVELKLGTLPPVECFPGKVNQVLMNILTNAVQATLARTDKAELAIRVETLVTGEHIQVRIKDNGIGMSGEVQSRMFDPFFTTKPVGEGTGLGLAIVYGIIQDHHGHIEVESTVGVGTEFKITLPIHQRQQLKQRA
jgi:signal transduction histidine kinase